MILTSPLQIIKQSAILCAVLNTDKISFRNRMWMIFFLRLFHVKCFLTSIFRWIASLKARNDRINTSTHLNSYVFLIILRCTIIGCDDILLSVQYHRWYSTIKGKCSHDGIYQIGARLMRGHHKSIKRVKQESKLKLSK